MNKSYDTYLQIVDEYISGEFNGLALSIYGDWGSGKTFFIKSILSNHIDQQYENRTLFYVSLNGLSNISDLYYRLLTNYLGDSKWALPANVFLKSLENITAKKLNVIEKSDVNNIKKMMISKGFPNLKNKIICFDDFERIDKNLNYEELLGFISNEFLEDKNIKVIFVSHDKEISSNRYNKIKEKYIYKDINFSPDISEIFENLLIPFKEEEAYYEYLHSQKDFIISLTHKNINSNIRTLKYFMDSFKKVFNYCPDEISDDVKFSVFLFTFICSYEYKLGNLSSLNESVKMIPKSSLEVRLIDGDKNITEKDVYAISRLSIYNKYIINYDLKYHFYHSILVYIIEGFIDQNNLVREINDHDPSMLSEHLKLENELSNFELLEDDEFKKKIEAVVEHLNSGSFDLYSLPSIIGSLNYFQHQGLISLDLEQIIDSAITEGMKTFEFDIMKYDYFKHSTIKYTSELSKMLTAKIIGHVSKVHDQDTEAEVKEMFKNILTNNDLKSSYLKTNLSIPIFAIMPLPDLMKYISTATNEGLNLFSILLNAHFEYHYYKDLQDLEKENLAKFRDQIDGLASKYSDDSLKKYLLNKIGNNIKSKLE